MSNAVIKLDIPNARIPVLERDRLLTKPMVQFFTDLVRRLGGQRTDFVAEARGVTLANQAMLRALTFGITTGYYHTPSEADILDFTPTSATTATITVAEHTRSTAAAIIQAGSIAGVTRGLTYYVYYDDVGNAGGAVTFAATTDVSILTVAGRKTISALYVAPPSPAAGTEA